MDRKCWRLPVIMFIETLYQVLRRPLTWALTWWTDAVVRVPRLPPQQLPRLRLLPRPHPLHHHLLFLKHQHSLLQAVLPIQTIPTNNHHEHTATPQHHIVQCYFITFFPASRSFYRHFCKISEPSNWKPLYWTIHFWNPWLEMIKLSDIWNRSRFPEDHVYGSRLRSIWKVCPKFRGGRVVWLVG